MLDEIHWEYLRSMARVAIDDGVVTDTELSDLRLVAELVGLTSNHIDTALAMAPMRHACAEFALAPGDVLCLTGVYAPTPVRMGSELGQLGLAVGALTRRTRILIAADPDSASGKAKKAREYGIPIINEDALLRLVERC